MTARLIAILTIIFCLFFNEFTLPSILGIEQGSLTAADRTIVRVIDLVFLTFGALVVVLRKNRPALVNLGLTAGSFLVILVIVELSLRLVTISPEGVNIYVDNPSGQGSFRLKKDYTKTVVMGSSTIAIQTNSDGMHWSEVPVDDPEERQTIAFVGDSFTFGLWASHWSKGLVGVFDKALGIDEFETLNFGVPGYGFADMELQIKEVVIDHDPEHIVIVSYLGNDLLDTYLGIQRYKVSDSGLLMFRPEVLEGKVPQQYWRTRAKTLLDELSMFESVKLVTRVAQKYSRTRKPPAATEAFARKDYESNIFWSQTEYPDFGERALDASLESLRRIHKYCLDSGITLSLIAIPSQEQVYFPDQFENGYNSDLPQRYFEEFARAEGIAYFDLLPYLQKWTANNVEDLHFRFDGHFNDLGHEISGQLIATFFARRLSEDMVPGSSTTSQ